MAAHRLWIHAVPATWKYRDGEFCCRLSIDWALVVATPDLGGKPLRTRLTPNVAALTTNAQRLNLNDIHM